MVYGNTPVFAVTEFLEQTNQLRPITNAYSDYATAIGERSRERRAWYFMAIFR
jgi:hypothetical protein